MKKLLYLCLFLLFAIAANAQPYGNEWINHSQRYLRVNIINEGIYRIDSASFASALSSIGETITSIDPRGIQVYSRGEEQYIYVNGEADGTFNSGDFIEFYATRNDGYLDKELYGDPSLQPNPYMSIVNDTAAYYITWNNLNINNNRLSIENDTTFSQNTASEPFFWKESIYQAGSDYYGGATNSVGGTSPYYTKAEGWFDWPAITLGGPVSSNRWVQSTNAYTSGPDAKLEMVFTGQSKHAAIPLQSPDHRLFVEISQTGSAPWTPYIDTLFHGYELLRFNYALPVTQMGASYTEFRYSSISDPSFSALVSYNRVVLSHIYLKYPHTMTVENNSTYRLIVPNSTQPSGKARLDLTNFNSSSSTPFLYDVSNHKKLFGVANGTSFQVLVPNSGTNPEKVCFLASNASTISLPASSLKPVNSSGYFVDYLQQAADSVFLIVTHKKLMAKALDYKTYRESSAGGGHNVIVADVQDLYDQFVYGNNKNPLAIRRFSEFLIDTFNTEPQYLFLIGKSLASSASKYSTAYLESILVPTFGYPGADVLFTAGLNGYDSLVPVIPTGRLSAKEDYQVDWYLEKVKQYDTTEVAEWKKRILHFAGGSTSNEQISFQNYLKSYEDTIENAYFGGNVITFKKTSSAPIQINQSDSLRYLIEGGVSMMTFFGHASGTGFDQSIDDPQNYNNLARYPLLLANSCYAGDIHSMTPSSSEKFVLLQDKGVIGYIASVSLGVPHALNAYSSELYRSIARRSYGRSIGWCMKEAISAHQNTNDEWIKLSCMEMTLHGDPAVVINSHPLPDYRIINADISFDLDYRPDTFIVYASVTNIGKAIRDTFMIEFKRKFPNGDTAISLLRAPAPLYQGTYSVKLPVDFVRGPGLNKMQVSIDATSEVDEIEDYLNNMTSEVPFVIRGSNITPVYPYNYAVVPNNTVTLKASTGDPFAIAKNYVFQIDTTDLFNSPQLRTATINSPGGVVEWTPPLTFTTDSMVYFWRVSPDSIDSTGYIWKESSFQYIAGEHGWGQAHFFQFKNDEYEFVTHNRTIRQFEFVNDVRTLKARNFILSYTGTSVVSPEDMQYSINNSVMKSWSCVWPGGVNIAVFDPVSAKPWLTSSNTVGIIPPYENYICWPGVYPAFDIADFDSTWRERIRRFLDTIPNGHKVLVYSIDVHNTSQFTNAQYEAFDSIGSANIRNIADTVPYIIFGEKGALPGTAHEVIGTHKKDIIDLVDTLKTNWNTGYIASEIIGPATSWNRLSWRHTSLEPNSQDSIRLNVVGIKANGDQDTLVVFPPDSMDVPSLGTYVNASMYPYLKLVAFEKDDSLRTPPQLQRWHVMYTPMPEAAVDPDLGYSFYNDTVQEGENVMLALAVQNISQYAFNDSIVFTYWLEDKDHIIHTLPYKLKKKPFSPGEIIIDTLTLNTEGYPGLNTLWLEVNPLNHAKSQLEQYHFNNLVNIDFFVSSDKINPLLDVTFDGIHILNRDIVSAKPNILVQLKDENRFLALNDSSDFKVFIKSPSQTVQQPVQWGQELSFTPAVLPKNSCKINYTPVYAEDGIYELIVQAKDKSDNQSGAIDYKIEFEVVNKPTITSVLNYPNPFSTSTRFVFTLTGSEVPSNFKIQIMTVTGKVVREIDETELGNIHIGRNITEYAWDGKDQYGDQLANGIYLYRILTQLNGNEIEKRETSADQYFTKGFGKMYLIR